MKSADDVQALFDAALRQQLQGPPCAGAAQRAVSCAIEVDILRGESRTPEFLAKNPSGQVPLLEVADGRYLAEIQRHPVVCRRRHARWRRNRGSSAPRRCNGCSSNSTRWSRISARPISGCRWSRAAATCRRMRWKTGWSAAMRALQVMENHLKTSRLFRRRPAHRRRHRALRLHPCRRPLRLRSGDLPGDPRLAAGGSNRPPASSPWTGSPEAEIDDAAERRRRGLNEAAPSDRLKTPPKVKTLVDSGQNLGICRGFAIFRAAAAAILPGGGCEIPAERPWVILSAP